MSHKPKILSVDDKRSNLMAIRHILSRFDVELVEASSGNAALASAIEHEFALILLDVYMPDIDGFQVATLLSEAKDMTTTPIIFVTATYADDLNRLRGYRFGAVDYMIKPLNEEILASKIQVFLDLYKSKSALRRALKELAERNRQLEEEIAERRRIEQEMLHLATHDGLTGLPNSRCFSERLRGMIDAASVTGKSFTVLYFDIDHFKPINDRYGHYVGDQVLQLIAQRLQECFGETQCVARLGGDEFVGIMDSTDSELMAACIRDLQTTLSEPLEVKACSMDTPLVLTLRVSIGTAVYPASGNAAEILVRAADQAMYRDKQANREALSLHA